MARVGGSVLRGQGFNCLIGAKNFQGEEAIDTAQGGGTNSTSWGLEK